MIKITDISQCSGCFACASACPQNCISMISDNEGFLYPNIDVSHCVNCDLCVKACPIINKKNETNVAVSAYAAINNDEGIRGESSSGGIFTYLAEQIIKKGGIVFGAAFSEDFKYVKHISVSEINELFKLRGSKYLQSRIGNTYKEAEAYLKKGVPVYFSGTPCQISGLYSYLGKEYDNLYTQDIICHGVPSPLVWEKYVENRESVSGSYTKKVFFRNKETGWKNFLVRFVFEDGTEYSKSYKNDLYMKGFISNLFLRPSCHNCNFKTVNRIADITLADFWGVEVSDLKMDDDKGTSLVLIHSDKGKELFENFDSEVLVKKADLEFAVKANSAILTSVTPHNKRSRFFKKLENSNIDDLIYGCLKVSTYNKYLITIKRHIKKTLKRLSAKKI